MLSKLIIAGLIGTGFIGAGSASTIMPSGLDFAAGPLRIMSGNGKGFVAKFDKPAPVMLTFYLKNQQRVNIRF